METDEALVKRTRSGDLTAFEELVRRHRASVELVAARIVGREGAEDVAQDAFLRAFHTLERFRGEAAFKTWLLRIAHNTALNALAPRRPAALEAGEEPTQELPAPGPASALEDRERRERLRVKLAALRPAHRSVLVLRDLEGLSYQEIAETTDMPIGSVKGRLHRAREELIELLRANTYDWELPE